MRTWTTILTLGLLAMIVTSCNNSEKEIYENVYLKKHESHYSLQIKPDKGDHSWVYLVVDSMYCDNEKTIYTYGLALRSDKKGWFYVTNGPSFSEGGQLPDEPYKNELKTMTGQPLNYHKLIPIEDEWNKN